MADEPVGESETPSEIESTRPSHFRITPFSRTSAEWVSAHELRQIEAGQLTASNVLRRECQREGQAPPTEDELAAFTASLEEVKTRHDRSMAQLADQLTPNVKLAEQLGAKFVAIPPGLLEGIAKADENLRSMASAVRQLDRPQPIPDHEDNWAGDH